MHNIDMVPNFQLFDRDINRINQVQKGYKVRSENQWSTFLFSFFP